MCSTSSLFDGRLPGTPIVVDAFAPPSSSSTSSSSPLVFLLTHYHADHISGLSARFSLGPIYCSAVTRSLVLLDFPRLRSLLRPLTLEERHSITVPGAVISPSLPPSDYTFHVTLIDSNHCPGSVMLLLRLPGVSGPSVMLHTGDFRYDPLRCHSPLLQAAIGSVQALYADTTFLHPNSAHFPSKAAAARSAIRAIARYFKAHAPLFAACKAAQSFTDGPRVYLAAETLGTEELLLSLHAHFHFPLHLSSASARWRQLSLLKQTHAMLTDDGSKTPIELVSGRALQRWMRGEEANRKAAGRVPGLYIKPSAMWWARKSGDVSTRLRDVSIRAADASADDEGDEDDDEGAEEKAEDPASADSACQRDVHGVLHVLWSMHSDMSELMEFIQLVQPRTVIPLVVPALTPREENGDDRATALEDDEEQKDGEKASGPAVQERLGFVTVKHEAVDGVKRRRLSGPLFPAKESARERELVVLCSIQHIVNTLLPRQRVAVMSAAQRYKKEEEQRAHASGGEPSATPRTPPLLAVQRTHSSPSKLQTSAADAGRGERVLSRILHEPQPKKEEDAEGGSATPPLPALSSNRVLFASAPLMSSSSPTVRSLSAVLRRPPPAASPRHPQAPFVLSGLSLTPLAARHFDFSITPAPSVYIAKDIRGDERAALSTRLSALGIPHTRTLSREVRLVLMRWGRASSEIVFGSVVRRVVRLLRNEHALRAERGMPGPTGDECAVWVYAERCVDEVERVQRDHAGVWTAASRDAIDTCMLWHSAELSAAKVNELLDA